MRPSRLIALYAIYALCWTTAKSLVALGGLNDRLIRRLKDLYDEETERRNK